MTLDAEVLNHVVERVTARWKDGTDSVVVVDSLSALPADIQEDTEKQGAEPDEIPNIFHNGKV